MLVVWVTRSKFHYKAFEFSRGLFTTIVCMTRILSFETSTTTCGIALISEIDGVTEIFQRTVEGVSGHAEHLLPMATEVLALGGIGKDQLDAVAFGQGPGAFTGLRLACGAAQGIGLALGIPLIPVGALQAVAAAASARHPGCLILPALDARMHEMYLGACIDDPQRGLVMVAPPVLIDAEGALSYARERMPLWLNACGERTVVVAAGDGWRLAGVDALVSFGLRAGDLDARPTIEWVARLALAAWARGQTVPPEHAAPFYLRDKVAYTTAERAAGEGGNPRAVNPRGMTVLRMTAADVPEVVEIERQVQSFPWTVRNFEDALHAGYEAWCLHDGDTLAGFCIAMMAPDVAHVLVIAVARGAQRRGYGLLLLEQVAVCARTRSVDAIVLEVRRSNEDARAFYEKQGFETIGTRRDYYPSGVGQREDALVLKKTLIDA